MVKLLCTGDYIPQKIEEDPESNFYAVKGNWIHYYKYIPSLKEYVSGDDRRRFIHMGDIPIFKTLKDARQFLGMNWFKDGPVKDPLKSLFKGELDNNNIYDPMRTYFRGFNSSNGDISSYFTGEIKF